MLMHLLKDHFALDNDNKEPESSERKKKKKKRSVYDLKKNVDARKRRKTKAYLGRPKG